MNKRLLVTASCSVIILVLLYIEWQNNNQNLIININPDDNIHTPIAQSFTHETGLKESLSGKRKRFNIPFILNRGQKDRRVKFYASMLGGTVFVTETGELVYALSDKALTLHNTHDDFQIANHDIPDHQKPRDISLMEEFVGGNPRVVKGEMQSQTKINIFHGSDRSKWQSNTPSYDMVSLGEVYEGVEVKLNIENNALEKIFNIHSGADTGQIRLRVIGGDQLHVNSQGELVVGTNLGEVKFSRPIAYQENNGNKQLVEVAYEIDGDSYKFRLGDYDQTKQLVIDPFVAGTYLGGGDTDSANGIALDASGNVYIVGNTSSPDFPGINGGSIDDTLVDTEAYVVKMDDSLGTILSATFLGGNGTDQGLDIVSDDSGYLYVAGGTDSPDFPGIGIGIGSADDMYGGDSEGFVTKLNSNLDVITSSTFLGGSDSDEATSIVLSSTGDLYIAGNTSSNDFPGIVFGSSADAYLNGISDVFIARLNSNLNAITAATYLGGSGIDGSSLFFNKIELALNSSGNVYVTGTTTSPDFPGISVFSADDDPGDTPPIFEAFVASLSPSLNTILNSTYLGGSTFESGFAIAIDNNDDVYVGGQTNSHDFPGISPGAADKILNGIEGFTVKLDPTLAIIQSATFLGGGGDTEQVFSLKTDSMNNVYATGSASPGFPGVDFGSADSSAVGGEAFAARLNGTLNFVDATFIGGSDNEFGNEILVDPASGNIYVVGETRSSPFPGISTEAADSIFGGFSESFVVELDSFGNLFISNLNVLIAELNRCPVCPPEVTEFLVDKVIQTIKQIEKGNFRPATNFLRQFVKKTEMFVKSGKLMPEEGQRLNALAEDIIGDLQEELNR